MFVNVPRQGDAGGANVVLEGMPADNVFAADASLEDAAVVTDKVVVADVAPTLFDRVVVVDRTDHAERFGVVLRRCVMDDHLCNGAVLRGQISTPPLNRKDSFAPQPAREITVGLVTPASVTMLPLVGPFVASMKTNSNPGSEIA